MEAVGITVLQVRKIRDGVIKDPRLSTVEKLAKHLWVSMC